MRSRSASNACVLLAAVAAGIGCSGRSSSGATTGATGKPAGTAPRAGTSANPTGCTKIVIDPGHNSKPNLATEPIGPGSHVRKIKDGGGTQGVVTRVPESVVNLQISLRLRRLLVTDGYCVVMT